MKVARGLMLADESDLYMSSDPCCPIPYLSSILGNERLTLGSISGLCRVYSTPKRFKVTCSTTRILFGGSLLSAKRVVVEMLLDMLAAAIAFAGCVGFTVQALGFCDCVGS